jgi:PAS domain S-box-containing protein
MVMETLADQIAVAIENARLYEAVQQELTERKHAEEALRESEEKYRTMAEQSLQGLVIIQGFRIAFANTAFARIAGYTVEKLLALSPEGVRAMIHPEDQALVWGRFRDRLEGKPVPPRYEYRGIRKDGTVCWLEMSASRIEYGGKPAIQGALVDITERKRVERLLQTLNEAALAMQRALTREAIFAAVAEEFKKLGLSCMVFPTDESQSKLFTRYLSYEAQALKAAEKLVGLQHEDFSIPIETIGVYRRVVWEKRTVFVENAEDIMQQILPGLARGLSRQIVKMLKVPKHIPAPLIVEDKVIGVFSVQSDDLTEDDIPAITAFAHQMAAAWHKAQLMEDLQDSLEELKRAQAQLLQAQKMEAIGQLAGGIAHDFNNLLTSIGGFTELLLREAPEGSQPYEDLLQIKVATERATALTRQLLLFTRQKEGKHYPIQLNSVVEETHDLLERSIPKEITIELHLEPQLWTVEADPSQMSQVLMNLCLNARDAMPDGGTLTLETRNVTLDEERAQAVLAAQPGRYVRLSVSDTGCGMRPEVQARLFEPFFTTKEVGKGTGLGLAVAYGIVRGHGGFITTYSEEGEGSTFRIYLLAIESAVEEREAEELELPTGTETILLVDDEETVRKLGQRILERCGYIVLMAANGFQALEIYQTHRGEIALVVLDMVMPQMRGRECLRRLQKLDPQVRVLISTGYTANSSAQEMVSEGALGVVEKPFLLQDFAIAVRMALDKP